MALILIISIYKAAIWEKSADKFVLLSALSRAFVGLANAEREAAKTASAVAIADANASVLIGQDKAGQQQGGKKSAGNKKAAVMAASSSLQSPEHDVTARSEPIIGQCSHAAATASVSECAI